MNINKITSFTHFSEEELNNLSDAEIVEGFKEKNPQVTKKFFFGYCEIAYKCWDKIYALHGKEGVDSITLTTDYYVELVTKDWKPLEEERYSASLKTWMIRGYRFHVLDALVIYCKKKLRFGEAVDENLLPDEVETREPSVDLKIDIEYICKYLKNPDDKLVLRKYILEEYTFTELAKELDVTVSAVSQRYNRIKRDIVLNCFNGKNTI